MAVAKVNNSFMTGQMSYEELSKKRAAIPRAMAKVNNSFITGEISYQELLKKREKLSLLQGLTKPLKDKKTTPKKIKRKDNYQPYPNIKNKSSNTGRRTTK